MNFAIAFGDKIPYIPPSRKNGYIFVPGCAILGASFFCRLKKISYLCGVKILVLMAKGIKMVSAAPADSNKGAYMLANPEEFRLVPDLDKPYYVSNYGRVVVEEDGQRRELTLQKDGRYVYVRIGGRVHKVSMSYMVARAFVNNLCLRQYVRHIDGDSSNNCAGNLEWCEFQEVNRVDKKGKVIQRTKGVLQYNKDGELVRRWNSVTEASRNTDLQRGRILEAIKGKRNSAGGYIWRFELN